jgi:hypothetical protein
VRATRSRGVAVGARGSHVPRRRTTIYLNLQYVRVGCSILSARAPLGREVPVLVAPPKRAPGPSNLGLWPPEGSRARAAAGVAPSTR